MTDIPTIRRRRDGSIDTAYYLAKGKCRRSEAAHEMAGQASKKARHMLFGLAPFLASLPFLGGQG